MRARGHRPWGAMRGAIALVVLAVLPACDKSGPTSPTSVCTYTLSAQGQQFSAEGGAGSVTISTDSQCTWSVENATGWISLQSAVTGTGSGSVNFTVSTNSDPAGRAKTLTVASVPFTISQDGRTPCSYSISPEETSFDDEGGKGQVTVTALAGCAWSAKSQASWISVTAGAQGQGTGTVSFTVASNNATATRTGTLTIGNRTLTVTQRGEAVPPPLPVECRYSVAPVDFSPCMASGNVTAVVTAQANCQWTATSSGSWLTLPTGGSGNGSGVITIRYSDNYDAPRDGTVMVRWPSPTQGQNIRVAQAGCVYGVSATTTSFPSAGGTATFGVVQQSQPTTCGGATQDRCVWTAQSHASWIVITSSMPRVGDSPVSFTVAPNPGTAARSGTISVRNRVVTVTQAAP